MLFLQSNEQIFRFSNPTNVSKSFDGRRDHLLTQARSELMQQEHIILSNWNCRTPITDPWNLEESKYDYKKNYL